MNALCARWMFALGALMVALEFVLPASVLVQTLRGIGIAGLAIITVASWRTASRSERQRSTGVGDQVNSRW